MITYVEKAGRSEVTLTNKKEIFQVSSKDTEKGQLEDICIDQGKGPVWQALR